MTTYTKTKQSRVLRRDDLWVTTALFRRVFYGTLSLLALSVIGYVSLTGVAVWNTNQRVENEKQIAQLVARVGQLEVRVVDLHGTISEKFAYSKGFEESNSVKYISAKSHSRVARLNETEL